MNGIQGKYEAIVRLHLTGKTAKTHQSILGCYILKRLHEVKSSSDGKFTVTIVHIFVMFKRHVKADNVMLII